MATIHHIDPEKGTDGDKGISLIKEIKDLGFTFEPSRGMIISFNYACRDGYKFHLRVIPGNMTFFLSYSNEPVFFFYALVESMLFDNVDDLWRLINKVGFFNKYSAPPRKNEFHFTILDIGFALVVSEDGDMRHYIKNVDASHLRLDHCLSKNTFSLYDKDNNKLINDISFDSISKFEETLNTAMDHFSIP